MPVTPEFSRPFAPDSVPQGGISVSLTATPAECRALAERFDLERLDRLEGELRLELAGNGDLLRVVGRVRADLAQRCVVTLEPVGTMVDAEFERLFSRDMPVEVAGEVEVDAEADLPEPWPKDALDLGEMLAEELSLALEPYPRVADADSRLAELEQNRSRSSAGSFAALAALRKH